MSEEEKKGNRISRRQFLKSTAIATGAVTAATFISTTNASCQDQRADDKVEQRGGRCRDRGRGYGASCCHCGP